MYPRQNMPLANSIREKMIANFILTALLCLTVSYSTIQKPARDANGTDGETQAWTSWHTSKVATQSQQLLNHKIKKDLLNFKEIFSGEKVDPAQLKKHTGFIITDQGMYSDEAVDLCMITFAQESAMGRYIEQLGGGPAKGINQMEGVTHDDIWVYLDRKGEDFKQKTIYPFMINDAFGTTLNKTLNIAYQIAMTRLHYWRVPEAIPSRDQFDHKKQYIRALAEYWKKHYNTHLGAGTVDQAVSNYYRYVEGKA